MVEIGPGLGAMTQPLLERAGALTVIELDRDLALRLRSHAQLTVIESDVLKVAFDALAPASTAASAPATYCATAALDAFPYAAPVAPVAHALAFVITTRTVTYVTGTRPLL